MSINEPVLAGDDLEADHRALLQAVVVQLHQVTERVTTLEQQLDPSSAVATPAKSPSRGQLRRTDRHTHRQTGWQPTRR